MGYNSYELIKQLNKVNEYKITIYSKHNIIPLNGLEILIKNEIPFTIVTKNTEWEF